VNKTETTRGLLIYIGSELLLSWWWSGSWIYESKEQIQAEATMEYIRIRKRANE
jgi:hypothetical protein